MFEEARKTERRIKENKWRVRGKLEGIEPERKRERAEMVG